MKTVLIVSLMIICSVNILSQNHLVDKTEDFLINAEYSPATFIQTDPQIYPNNNDVFIITWKDYRQGEPTFYAQNYSNSGEKVGLNYQTDYSQFTYGINNNQFRTRSSEWLNPCADFDSYYYTYGRVFFPDGSFSEEFQLCSIQLPWCGTGWMGIHEKFISVGKEFIYLLNAGGRLEFSKIDSLGNIIFNSINQIDFTDSAIKISLAPDLLGNFGIFYFDAGLKDSEPGVYGAFINQNNNLIGEKVKIFEYETADFGIDNSPIVISYFNSVNSFTVVSFDIVSMKIFYRNVDVMGNLLTEKQTLEIPEQYPGSGYNELSRFFKSNLKDGTLSLFFTIEEDSTKSDKVRSHIVRFNPDGSLFTNVYYNGFSFSDYGDYVYHINGNEFFVPYRESNDVFKARLTDFDLSDIELTNDDEVGGNQKLPEISITNNNTFFAMWDNEELSYGIEYDLEGNPISVEREIWHNNYIFFEDGNIVSHCKKFCGSDWRIGFRYLNSDFETLGVQMLGQSDYEYKLGITSKKISSNQFVLAYVENNKLYCQLAGSEGQLIKNVLLNDNCFSIDVKIFLDFNETFWVYWNGHAKKLNSNLDIINELNFSFSEYLGDDVFIYSYKDNTSFKRYGKMYDSTGDSLTSTILLCENADDFKIQRFTEDTFLCLSSWENNIYVTLFSRKGEKLTDPLMIHDPVDSFKKIGSFQILEDKVMFLWTDTRLGTTGYDVWGSLFDLSDFITVDVKPESELPNEFTLKQNYPNPFNPSTTIEYTIPTVEHAWSADRRDLSRSNKSELKFALQTTLKIYDITGKEVATIVNEEQSSGNYKVQFDASDLTTGVYFYRLKAGEFTQTKKMILLQ